MENIDGGIFSLIGEILIFIGGIISGTLPAFISKFKKRRQ